MGSDNSKLVDILIIIIPVVQILYLKNIIVSFRLSILN